MNANNKYITKQGGRKEYVLVSKTENFVTLKNESGFVCMTKERFDHDLMPDENIDGEKQNYKTRIFGKHAQIHSLFNKHEMREDLLEHLEYMDVVYNQNFHKQDS